MEAATNELMESLSEYFRNRFTDLAPQERTILDAFSEMDGPATPKEIAKKTRIKEQSIYAHIKNLKDAGFIEIVEFGKHKISRYDVTERLFRLWRQNATISGRRRFKVLIKLLKVYFTPEELKEDFHRSIKQLDAAFPQNKWKVLEEHLHYLSYLQYAAEGSLKFDIFDKRTDFLLKKGDYEKIEEEIFEFRSEIEVEGKYSDLKPVYMKLLQTHLQQKKYDKASKDINELLKYPIADEKEKPIEISDEIINERPDDAHIWAFKGRILLKTGDSNEALKCFNNALPLIEKAIELDGKDLSSWSEKAKILAELGRYEEGIRCFRESIELNPENIDHNIVFWGFLIFNIKDLKEPGNYLEEIEKTLYEQIIDHPGYLHYKSDYLILTCQFETAISLTEKRFK